MFRKSSLGPTISLLIGISLAASACGISVGEDDQSATLESTGIGAPAEQQTDDSNGQSNTSSDGSDSTDGNDSTDSGDSNGPVAAPVATSIPSDGEVADDQEPDSDEPTQAEHEAFCDASADYFVASQSANYVNFDRPGEVSMLYKVMDARLDEAIDLAPTDELAEPALYAREHFTILHAAMEQAKYDPAVVESSANYDELQVSLQTMIDIDDLLETYLTDACGYSSSGLEESSKMVAEDIAGLVDEVLTDSGVSDGDYPGDYIEIGDSTDRLKVEVPIDWEDTQSEPTRNGSALTIAPDVSTYLTSWRADGMKMTVTDAPSPIDWRAPMYETNASSDCTLTSSEPYSDALYTGWIDRYINCAGGPASAVVIGATDEDFSIEILVEVQFDNVDTQNDEATLTQILDTFKAR